MSSLKNRKPLCIGKSVEYYRDLYMKDHSEFCRRFIDTILIQHFEKIINLSVSNNVDMVGIDYKIKDTDAFLWMIRDLLDNFLMYKYVKDAIFHKDITNAIEQMFAEIKLEYRFIQLLFVNSEKNTKQ